MNIDTRFPVQPDVIKVPLYPLQTDLNFYPFWKSDFETELRSRIASTLKCPPEACILSLMGRHILIQFLHWMQKDRGKQIAVALPAFYCPHTCSALKAAGIRIILIDIDFNFQITKAGIDFALISKCDVLIWPDLFVGINSGLELLQNNPDIFIVRDIAHTFPLAKPDLGAHLKRSITLFSLGPNKLLCGAGGGGVVIYDDDIKDSFTKYLNALPIERRRHNIYFNHLLSIGHANLRRHAPRFAAAAGVLPALYKDQRELLEATLEHEIASFCEDRHSITEWQASIALNHWDRMSAVSAKHTVYKNKLVTLLEYNFGPAAVGHLLKTDYFATFAIRLESGQRYTLSNTLARRGIQTTWYYYPLTKLSAFSHCERQATPISELMANSILVLPMQWPHVEKNLEAIMNWADEL